MFIGYKIDSNNLLAGIYSLLRFNGSWNLINMMAWLDYYFQFIQAWYTLMCLWTGLSLVPVMASRPHPLSQAFTWINVY